MLSNLKLKFGWYRDRLLSEIFIRKVLFFSKRQTTATLHALPNKLVVSLTSYIPRFKTLLPTILTLIQQKIAPNTILLWVSHEDYSHLPDDIMKLQGKVNNQGTTFEILKTDDTGPYKKIIPTLERFPDSFIVTAYDDVYYPKWWLKNLINEYNGNNREILCYRAHEISFSAAEKTINPYNYWKRDSPSVDKHLGFPVGIGGVFYPPNSLHDLVTRHELYKKICPMADDIWLFWMARKQGSTVKKVSRKFSPICWPSSQKIGLINQNVQNNANDLKIKNMIDRFGWPLDNVN